ncbi:MAG: InlB B-repeat-containing protein, partial [Propionibacteriaceae bacterium]|nr:InlB B-repeat-containing protein [Propionibacteriaceae bacterium]
MAAPAWGEDTELESTPAAAVSTIEAKAPPVAETTPEATAEPAAEDTALPTVAATAPPAAETPEAPEPTVTVEPSVSADPEPSETAEPVVSAIPETAALPEEEADEPAPAPETSVSPTPSVASVPRTRLAAPATGTVTFMLNNTDEYFVTGYAPQTVTIGSTVVEPIHPTVPTGYVTFRGWSVYNPAHPDHDFEFYTRDKFWAFDGTVNADTVTGDVTLYAVFDDRWLLSFSDGSGTVLLTRRVAVGDTYAGPTQAVIDLLMESPPNEGDRIVGWEEDAASGYYGGDVVFGSSEMPNHDLIIKPKWASTRVVTFDSRGGTYVAPKLPVYNTAVAEPTSPTRTGYDFGCWTANAAATSCATDAWSFTTPVTADTMLYAIWEAKPVGYTVVYWGEKKGVIGDPGTTATNYEFLDTTTVYDTDTNLAKLAGTSMSCTSATLTDCFTTAEQAALDTLLPFPDFFTLSWVAAPNLAGDGTTVVNVYFKRTVYTFQFDVHGNKQSVNNTNPDYPNYNTAQQPNAYLTMGGVEYQRPGTANANVLYSFTAKWGEDISTVWPAIGSVTHPSGWNQFGWWIGNGSQTPHSIQFEVSDVLATAAEAGGGTVTMSPEWSTDSAVIPIARLYYFEATAAEYASINMATVPNFSDTSTEIMDANGTAHRQYIVYDNKLWVLQMVEAGQQTGFQKCQTRQFEGVTPVYTNGNTTTLHTALAGNDTDGIADHANSTQHTTSSTGTGANTDKLQYAYFLYTRNSFNISYITGVNQTIPSVTGVQLGAPLTSYEPTTTLTNTGYSFEGWCVDNPSSNPNCLPFDFATEEMPGSNLILYAKWAPNSVKVDFYDA